MRAATYTRISSELQSDGHSLDAQEQACERLCAERGWQVVLRYSDVESGRTAERPQFQTMLRDAERRLFDVMVVHKLDRFSRSVVDTLQLLKRLESWHVSFVTAAEQFDFTTPIGKVLLTQLAAFAQWYLDNLSQETAKGKRARAEKGLWNSMVPYGYSIAYLQDGGDGMPRPDPDTSVAVRLAFEHYATGVHSDMSIASFLNAQGYRPQGRGKRALPLWSKDSVRWMLTNRFYVGEVQYRGQPIQAQHEPLIDRTLFDKCQQVRASRRHKHGCTATNSSRVYPLSGIVFCARCNTRMRATSSKCGHRLRYYRDTSAERGVDCGQRFVRAQEAEDALGAFLSGIELPEDWRAQIMRLVADRAGRNDYESETRRLREQSQRWKQLFVLGDVSEREYTAERERIRAAMAVLSPPELPDLEKAAALLGDFSRIWTAATDRERQQILRSLLDAVYLDHERGPVVAITPKPQYQPLFCHVRGRRASPNNAAEIRILAPGERVFAPEEEKP